MGDSLSYLILSWYYASLLFSGSIVLLFAIVFSANQRKFCNSCILPPNHTEIATSLQFIEFRQKLHWEVRQIKKSYVNRPSHRSVGLSI